MTLKFVKLCLGLEVFLFSTIGSILLCFSWISSFFKSIDYIKGFEIGNLQFSKSLGSRSNLFFKLVLLLILGIKFAEDGFISFIAL